MVLLSDILGVDPDVAIPIITSVIGIAGGYGGHLLSYRLSSKGRQEKRAEDRRDKEADEDRERALALAPVADQFMDRYGRGTPYVDDGRKPDWGDDEWQRADEYDAALADLLPRISAARLAFHDSSTRLLLITITTLGRYSRKALEERQPSMGAVLVTEALDVLSSALDNRVLGFEGHNSDLQRAVDQGVREAALGDLTDRSHSAVLKRIYDLWIERP